MPVFFDNFLSAFDLGNNPSNPSDVGDEDSDTSNPSDVGDKDNDTSNLSNQESESDIYFERLSLLLDNLEELGPDEYYCILTVDIDKTVNLEDHQALKSYLHSCVRGLHTQTRTLFKDKSSVIEFIDKWKHSPIGTVLGQFMIFTKYGPDATCLVKFRMLLENGIQLKPAKMMHINYKKIDLNKLRAAHQYQGQVYQLDNETIETNQDIVINNLVTNPSNFFSRLPRDVIRMIKSFHSPDLLTPQITIQNINTIPDSYKDTPPLMFNYRSAQQGQQADNETHERNLELKPPAPADRPRLKK